MTQQTLFDAGHNQASGAEFSPCRTWRYRLWRQWDATLPVILFIGLNPSTADETTNDRTINKCIKFAKAWGYGTYWMANLYGCRSTDPKGMRNFPDPIGPGNNEAIRDMAAKAARVVVAWGCHKGIDERAAEVLEMVADAWCLRITVNGFPWHPLYIPDSTQSFRYSRPFIHTYRNADD
ncbi:MAG: DUF1643 domain-containing protein [Planctomycetota bacterium]